MIDVIRCGWANPNNTLYLNYHDTEWGVPVHDDQKHFEFLILEGAQAGLSWETILKRRSGYRQAFAAFQPNKVANFDEADINRLLQDTRIIRNRLKIHSAITNAKIFLNIQKEFVSFDNYLWQFVDQAPLQNNWQTLSQIPASTPESERLSKDLKQRGMQFVGPTIIYAHIQACGLVNDHLVDCFRHQEVMNYAA